LVKSRKHLFLITMIVIMSCIGLYGGHFLFYGNRNPGQPKHAVSGSAQTEPVVYKHFSRVIHGNRQDFHVLEVDVSNPTVEIKPVLSHDSVFGFETLSSIAERSEAQAAVNGGFFYEFGQPTGIVMIDGRLITTGTAWFPAFIINSGKAALSPVKTSIRLDCRGGSIEVQGINKSGTAGETIVYTREYGSTNRVETDNVTLVVEKDTVTQVVKKGFQVPIPRDGTVITAFAPIPGWISEVQEGDFLQIVNAFSPRLDADAQAYECGSWIVRDGKVVVGTRDPWVGVMTNRDPRTALGIRQDGKVVLLTVDGRQPGHSAGLTGKELGEFLLEYGVRNAALLDGGASTEMIVDGKIVNKPSFKGQERPLAGGIIIKVGDEN
jgi:hypothetical protein